ncbi:MAG: sigma-54-dependent Fis family transcriptional regulator [Bdellovibrionaceae bacterium]|nr:sigma-54-dependent Fis family transcriptional regulator [Bdellovibrionales bacterium]MCB9086021.1 sigma-54-dependent Fis family transcriptional regulator [Pseudobdellovibrionaceae bacterium]
MKILIIEDDFVLRESLTRILRNPSVNEESKPAITTASTTDEAKKTLAEDQYDLAFFDLNLNGELAGIKLLSAYKNKVKFPVVISSYFDKKEIVNKAYNAGAEDFLRKPFSEDSIKLVFNRYFHHINSEEFISKILDDFVTEDSEIIQELHKLKFKPLGSSPIHIYGETGTGKEVVAHLIKKLNFPEDAPFEALNCNNLTGELFESQLFGHKKGSFTGAGADHIGCAKKADGGILFLDEIDKIPENIQDKFLRFIETGKFRPVGSSAEVAAKLLIVSAGSRPLESLIEKGVFRRDLKARLSGTTVYLKPIRERKSDISLQIDYFMKSHKTSGRVFSITDQAMKILTDYSWPENTREIKNFVESHLLSFTKRITVREVQNLQNPTKQGLFSTRYKILTQDIMSQVQKSGSLKDYIDQLQTEIVDYQLLQSKLEKPNAYTNKARLSLGMSSRAFYKYLNLGKEQFGHDKKT